MLTFDLILLYRDVGYSCQDRTVPPIFSTKLPQPDYQFENVRMQKTGVAFRVDVPISYAQACELTYIEVYSMGNEQADSFTWYGWIRRVEQIAGQNDACTIEWEIDCWRTYQHRLNFNSGTITQIDEATADTLQPFSGYDILRQQRYTAETFNLTPQKNSGYWFVVSYLKSQTSEQKFQITRLCRTDTYNGLPYDNVKLKTDTDQTRYNSSDLSKVDILISNGLGIQPDNVLGQWIVPFNPIRNYETITTDGTDYIVTIPQFLIEEIKPSLNETQFFVLDDSQLFFENINGVRINEYDITNTLETNDSDTQIIVDMLGNQVGTLPYMNKKDRVKISLNIYSTTCYITMKFYNQNDRQDYIVQNNENLVYSFSCVDVPIYSNQWSQYVYSGQKELDWYQRKINNDHQLEKGVSNTIQDVGTFAFTGSMVGMLGGPIGQAGGQAIGQGVGIQSSLVDFGIEQDTSKKYLEAREKAIQKSNQNTLIQGDNISLFYEIIQNKLLIYSQTLNAIILHPDKVSLSEYNQRISNFGKKLNYSFDSGFASKVKQYLNLFDKVNARPIQIVNASCHGQQPIDAINKIKEKLEAGVYIIEKN